MERGYEEDAVLVLKLVVQLALVQERSQEETIRAMFCSYSQGAGRGRRWGLAALGEKEPTRKRGTLYFNLQKSRMEVCSLTTSPAALSFLTQAGGLEQPQSGGYSGTEAYPVIIFGPNERPKAFLLQQPGEGLEEG